MIISYQLNKKNKTGPQLSPISFASAPPQPGAVGGPTSRPRSVSIAMRAVEVCHVRDCRARESSAVLQEQCQRAAQMGLVLPAMGSVDDAYVVFRVPGDMRFLNVVLSAIARPFRNRKINFICKAHFLAEDILLTGSGVSLSKRAVPCFQVPRKTLKMVIRNAVSTKHSDVACLQLERLSNRAYLLDLRESSSDSDVPSGGEGCDGAAVECHGPPLPPIRHSGPPQYIQPTSTPDSLRLQQVRELDNNRLQLRRIYLKNHDSIGVNVKRSSGTLFISRDDGAGAEGMVDYKRLKLSDSDSPPSQGHGDVCSDASGGNSRADEVGEDADDMEDESKDMDEQTSEDRLDSSLDIGSGAEAGTPPYQTSSTLNSPLKGLILGGQEGSPIVTATPVAPPANPTTPPPT